MSVPDRPPPTPPVELEAERAVLGAVLLEPSVLDSCVTALSPEDFYKERHRIVWATLQGLQRAGQGTDVLALRSELRRRGVFEAVGGETTLAILQEEGTVATQLPAYITLIREAAAARRLAWLGGALLDGASNGHASRDLIPVIQETLQHVAARAPSPAVAYLETLAEFLADEDPPDRVIFPDLLPAGVIMLLHGEPRSRKSLTAFELALAAATGTPPFGLERFKPAAPIGVLYLQEEDSRSLTRPRLRRLVTERCGTTVPTTLTVSIRRGVDLDDPVWVSRLIQDLTRLGVRLLVLDAARRFSAKTDEGPTKVREFTGVLRRIVTVTDVTIIIVHHDVKPPRDGQDQRRRSQRASGGDWFAACECPVHVERVDAQESLVYPQDYKFTADPAPFAFRCVADDRLLAKLVGRDLSLASAETAGARGQLLTWLRANGPATRTVIRKAGFAWETVQGLLDDLMREGLVDAVPGRQKDSLRYFAVGYETSPREVTTQSSLASDD